MSQTISKVKDDFEVINQFILFQVINNRTVSVLDSNEIKHIWNILFLHIQGTKVPNLAFAKLSETGHCQFRAKTTVYPLLSEI